MGLGLLEFLRTRLRLPVFYLSPHDSDRARLEKGKQGGCRVRVHPSLRDLPPSEQADLADVIEQTCEATDTLQAPEPSRRKSAGRILSAPLPDLKKIFADLNAEYFDGKVQGKIEWARRSPHRPRRSIRLGVYYYDEMLIRINPLLSEPGIPGYVLRSVVFHEMVHGLLSQGQGPATSRKRPHNRLFKNYETRSPDFRRAKIWEKKHLRWLLGRTEISPALAEDGTDA